MATTLYMPVNSSSATTTQAKSAASTNSKYFYIRLYITTSISGRTATLTIRLQAYVNDTTYGSWAYTNCGTSGTYTNSKSIRNTWTTFGTKTATASIADDGTYSYTFSGKVTGPSGTSFASKSATISSTAHTFTDGTKATYTITYDMNGGSPTISKQTKTYGTDITLSSTTPTRSGYSFHGWYENYRSGERYQPSATFTRNANTTLTAAWKIITTPIPVIRKASVINISDLTFTALGSAIVNGVETPFANNKLSQSNPINMHVEIESAPKIVEVHIAKVEEEGDIYERTDFSEDTLVYTDLAGSTMFALELSTNLMNDSGDVVIFNEEGLYLIRIGICNEEDYWSYSYALLASGTQLSTNLTEDIHVSYKYREF